MTLSQLRLLACLFLALGLVTPALLAEDPPKAEQPKDDEAQQAEDEGDPEAEEEEEDEDLSGRARGWLERMRGLGRRNPSERNHDSVRSAFREIVAAPSKSTVLVLSADEPTALGTVVSADGYILTKASELNENLVCCLKDGRKLPAKIVGLHDDLDLAMLKVDAGDLMPIVWNPDAKPAVGSWLTTPGIEDDPVAIGVVSVAPRRIRGTPGVLGVSLEDGSGAAKITEVMPRSAAEKAGLKKDDLVLSINGTSVKGREEMVRNVQGHKPGDVITLKVKRGETEMEFKATLGSHFTGPAGRGDVQDMMGGNLSMRRAGFAEALQHDTVLQPYQCGGPILDLDGKAIGVNIARAGRVNSYALPAKLVMAAIDDLKSGKLSPEALSEKAEMISALNRKIEEMSTAAGKAQAGYQQAEKDLTAAKEALTKAQAALDTATKQLESQKAAQDQAQAELEKLRKERAALQPQQ